MAVSNVPMFPQVIQGAQAQFLPADTTAEKDVFTAGANGSKVESILVTSTDTSNRDLFLYFSGAGGDYLMGCVQIPASSGNTNALPAINLLASAQLPLNTDAQGNKYLYVPATKKLRAAMGTTITAAKVVNLFIQAGDF